MSKTTPHIIIIGAGPGGLSSAMILANRGYRVTVFELENETGGRNRSLHLGDYTFDRGPTFLMMDFILREIFTLAGRNVEDYLELIPLDPMYKLNFLEKELYTTNNHQEMRNRIAKVFPGNEYGFDRFIKEENKRYEMLYPCLKKHYSTFSTIFNKNLRLALPYLILNRSLYNNLGRYFSDELCKLSFTFQAKYLGMSPWECPGLFTIIPYIEHAHGISHVKGGLSNISAAMTKISLEHGVSILTGTPVQKILTDNNRTAKGVQLVNGEKVDADAVVINADFGYAMETLFEPGFLKKYTPAKLTSLKLSCSTFMLYLCVDNLYPEAHHQIIFAKDYYTNITDISRGKKLSSDMSIYLRNASVTDNTLAPEGHSAVYVLVPVPNQRSGILWNEELVESYREKVLRTIEERTTMKDLRNHIVQEFHITPNDWQNNYHLYKAATFNLAHNLSQLLYLRPHNRFEECNRCYLVGGGTHPGSGLPTIYESARISSNLISEDVGKPS